MRSIVIYSSLTGNTKAVAEAVLEAMPVGTGITPIALAPPPDSYDLFALGFWVSKSGPDKQMAVYLQSLVGKTVILFGTMAGYPDSEYGNRVKENAEILACGNTLLGTFICQGRILDKRFEAYMSGAAQDSRHPLTPERKARLVAASKHPNANDFAAAEMAVKEYLQKL